MAVDELEHADKRIAVEILYDQDAAQVVPVPAQRRVADAHTSLAVETCGSRLSPNAFRVT